MVLKIEKTFYKDLSKISNAKLALEVKNAIIEFENAKTLREISGIKKLSGHRSAYRKRIGEFRIGFFAEGNTIEVICFLHRREIYRFFP